MPEKEAFKGIIMGQKMSSLSRFYAGKRKVAKERRFYKTLKEAREAARKDGKIMRNSEGYYIVRACIPYEKKKAKKM